MKILIYIIPVILIILKFQYHIHIDWQSLFKRGFAKIDNPFGLYCYTGKQRNG